MNLWMNKWAISTFPFQHYNHDCSVLSFPSLQFPSLSCFDCSLGICLYTTNCLLKYILPKFLFFLAQMLSVCWGLAKTHIFWLLISVQVFHSTLPFLLWSHNHQGLNVYMNIDGGSLDILSYVQLIFLLGYNISGRGTYLSYLFHSTHPPLGHTGCTQSLVTWYGLKNES